MSYAIRFRVRSAAGEDWHFVAPTQDRRGVRRGSGLAPTEGGRETRPALYPTREQAEAEQRRLELVQGQQCEFQVMTYHGGDHGATI